MSLRTSNLNRVYTSGLILSRIGGISLSRRNYSDSNLKVDQILDLALTKVPTTGWTQTSVALACEELGLSLMSHKVSENGGMGLIKHFFDKSLASLDSAASTPEFLENHDIKERVKYLSTFRIKQTTPYVNKWQEAVAILMRPENMPVALSSLSDLSNKIWHLSGDKSFNMDWYFKRAMLMSIYSSCELYMTKDRSLDHSITMNLLNTNVEKMFECDSMMEKLALYSKYSRRTIYNVLASKNILG